ncbi:MAG: hypothetical protein J7501_08475 [Bdellovibrio sp.]|nr:hypothetical protein [Bdellovibrio sp.]
MDPQITPQNWNNIKSALADFLSERTGIDHDEAERSLEVIVARAAEKTLSSQKKGAGTQNSGTVEEDSEEQAP